MPTTDRAVFVHPHKAYRLEYPAPWEFRVEDDGRSCGFGPRERDDVGLWISIMPVSLNTDDLAEHLPVMFRQSLEKSEAENLREDPTLGHYGLKADMTAAGQGGHYWLLAGGDLVLFASSQVPAAQRDAWNPQFDRLMSSLRITRDDELMQHKLAEEVLQQLRERHPDQDYRFHEKGIRGRNHQIFLGNLFREVRSHPDERDALVRQFIEGFASTPDTPMGYETWDDARTRLVPVLKPREYIKLEGPTQHLFAAEWLADVVICYAIRNPKTFRFVTAWDCDRWGIDGEQLHETALGNLGRMDWPRRMDGSRQTGGGRLILIHTGDSFDASRLLHPELHPLFSRPLGSPFLAGVPDRETLVVFTNRTSLRRRIARQVRKDYDKAAYPISPRLFLVTADGIALAGGTG